MQEQASRERLPPLDEYERFDEYVEAIHGPEYHQQQHVASVSAEISAQAQRYRETRRRPLPQAGPMLSGAEEALAMDDYEAALAASSSPFWTSSMPLSVERDSPPPWPGSSGSAWRRAICAH